MTKNYCHFSEFFVHDDARGPRKSAILDAICYRHLPVTLFSCGTGTFYSQPGFQMAGKGLAHDVSILRDIMTTHTCVVVRLHEDSVGIRTLFVPFGNWVGPVTND